MKSKPFKMKNPSLAKAMREGTPMQLNYGSPAKKDKKPETMKEHQLRMKQEQAEKADEVSYDKSSMDKKGKTRIPGTNIYEDKKNKELQKELKDMEERYKENAKDPETAKERRKRMKETGDGRKIKKGGKFFGL
jgi:small-conductance mechanosensitive channel|tara:strand:- start:6 stop:407 length:402 start_codon:yes stop_codon:yes gene_type:complete